MYHRVFNPCRHVSTPCYLGSNYVSRSAESLLCGAAVETGGAEGHEAVNNTYTYSWWVPGRSCVFSVLMIQNSHGLSSIANSVFSLSHCCIYREGAAGSMVQELRKRMKDDQQEGDRLRTQVSTYTLLYVISGHVCM